MKNVRIKMPVRLFRMQELAQQYIKRRRTKFEDRRKKVKYSWSVKWNNGIVYLFVFETYNFRTLRVYFFMKFVTIPLHVQFVFHPFVACLYVLTAQLYISKFMTWMTIRHRKSNEKTNTLTANELFVYCVIKMIDIICMPNSIIVNITGKKI